MNMPILPQFGNSEQSMNTLDISELVQSRHDKVKQSVERLVSRKVIALPSLGIVVKTVNNREYETEVYVFTGEQGKRDSIIVVAQLCPEFTARLVDRWQELEAQVVKPAMDLNNPEFLRQALLGYTEKVIELEQQVQLQAPKVAFVDKYVAGNGNKAFRQVTKLLGANERKFRDFLEKEKIMYKLNGEWLAYQNHLDAKRFQNNTGISENNHTFTRSLFTPKGVEWVAGEWAKFNLRGVV